MAYMLVQEQNITHYFCAISDYMCCYQCEGESLLTNIAGVNRSAKHAQGFFGSCRNVYECLPEITVRKWIEGRQVYGALTCFNSTLKFLKANIGCAEMAPG